MLKLMFIDTETTGTDTLMSGVWQIGGIIECGRRSEEFLFECDVFEENIFDPSVVEVTGITPEKLSRMADPEETHQQFVELLDKYIDRYDKKDKFTAVGYFAEFDQKIIRNWFERNDDDYFGSWFWHPWICVANAVAFTYIKDRSDFANFKMEVVADQLGIDFDSNNLHNALFDAKIAREIYYKLKKS
jgi:DNA polymerase-3 subunit epsilon